MSTDTLLRIAGVLQIAIALAHIPFARWFNWRTELGALSLLNRQIFYVHAFFIALTVLLFGLLAVGAPSALREPGLLAGLVTGGIAAFWLVRLVFQFFVYDPQLWRGHRGRTAIHIAVSGLWAYLAGVYGLVAVGNMAPRLVW